MRRVCTAILLILTLLLAGCGQAQASVGAGFEATPVNNPVKPQSSGSYEESVPEAEPDEQPFVPYKAPPFEDSVFLRSRAEGNEQILVDVSSVQSGYVGVSGISESRLKFQIIKDDVTYTYDLPSDGTPTIYPIQSGNGTYVMRAMENVVDTKYACIYSTEVEVALRDEFQPYIRPSSYVNYKKDSKCVKKAAELAQQAPDALGVVSAVYDFICETVVYDTYKAETVQSGYLPTPDETMKTGKGICFDYASLAAAMLRSQGIPTKVIFGYVSPDDLYHAWNMFYTTETGWVTVSYKVDKNNWHRLDLTFSANGADNEFIGNGENYADLFCY